MKISKDKTLPWQLKTLGIPTLEYNGNIVKLSRRKSFAILVYLFVSGRACSREVLARWFWPDLPEKDARVGLRSSLSDIRRTLSDGCLEQNGDSISIAKDFPIHVDILTLYKTAENNDLVSTLSLEEWQGDFLEGFNLIQCDVFDEWRYVQCESARNKLFYLMGLRLNHALENEEWPTVLTLADQWLALDPICEAAHMALMKHYSYSGEVSQALLQYKKLSNKLIKELGVQPSKATQRLKLDIEQGNKQMVAFSVSGGDAKASLSFISDIKYIKNDTVNIAYRQFGQGKQVLVFISGFVSHLEQLFEEPLLYSFLEKLAQRFSVLVFDKRGMGLSDRTGNPPTLEETSGDIIALLDFLGIDQCWLLGISEGGPAAIQCAHDYHHRIGGILLLGTTAKWTSSDDYSHSIRSDLYEKWLSSLESNWGTSANLEYFVPSYCRSETMVKWWQKTLRLASSPGAIKSVLESARDIDVRQYLPKISQPALIVQQQGDRLIRSDNGKYLFKHLPNAEYLELPGDDHWLWVCDTVPFFQCLDAFINKHTKS